MKYIIRRFVLAVILSPVVASAYFLFYAGLVGLGAQPTNTAEGVWANGWMLAIVLGLGFTFINQLKALEAKIWKDEN